MSGHFADRIKGLGLLRLYGRGDAELAGVEAAAEGVRVRTLKVLRIAFLSSTVLEFFASVSVAMVALYLGLSYLGMMSLHAAVPTLGAGLFCLLLAPEFYAPAAPAGRALPRPRQCTGRRRRSGTPAAVAAGRAGA